MSEQTKTKLTAEQLVKRDYYRFRVEQSELKPEETCLACETQCTCGYAQATKAILSEETVRMMLKEITAKLDGMVEFADQYFTAAARETNANTIGSIRVHLRTIASKYGIELNQRE